MQRVATGQTCGWQSEMPHAIRSPGRAKVRAETRCINTGLSRDVNANARDFLGFAQEGDAHVHVVTGLSIIPALLFRLETELIVARQVLTRFMFARRLFCDERRVIFQPFF